MFGKLKKKMVWILSVSLIMTSILMGDYMTVNANTGYVSYSGTALYNASQYASKLKNVYLTGNERADIVNVARSQIGYHEGNSANDYAGENMSGTNNYTEYNHSYYGNNTHVAWCAIFVSWCARRAGISTSVISNASVASPNGKDAQFKNLTYYAKGAYTPKAGDLIFFDWDQSGNFDHVGIVYNVTSKRVYTIEGNRDDAVAQKDYALTYAGIKGYGIPKYSGENIPASQTVDYNLYLNPNGGKFSDGATTERAAWPQLIYRGFNWTDVGTYATTRAGYAFEGWYTAPTGGTLVYGADNLASYEGTYWDRDNGYVYQGDLTVYAHWSENPKYNLYLNPNGGKFSDGATTERAAWPQLIYKGFNWNDVGTHTPTRDGYVFNGWYTAPAGGMLVYGADNLASYEGTYWDRDNGYVYQGDLTVYAHWIENQKYNLYLNPNGGKFSDGATTTKTASPQLIYKGFNWNDVGTYTATRDGYTFTGWYTAPTGGTLVYGTDNLACYEGTYWDRDNGYVYQGDLTVYAQWQSTHTHATTLVPAKAATCTEQGNIAYYTCTCGKWFEDSAASKEITDHTKVVTAALTHDWGTVSYTWSDDNSKVTATRTCKRDQKHIETETVNTSRTEVPAKCEEKGSIKYEASFANAAFKKQSKQVDVAALGHSLFKHDRVEATEEKPGNIAYWECSRCHALFADADGKQKTTLENTVIPAGTKPEVSKKGFVVYFDEDAGAAAVTYNADRDRYEYVYTGAKITPAVIVAQDGVQLAAGTDYTVKYSNNINVDKSGKPAAVTITGKGNFSGSKTVEFYVVAKRLDDGAGKAAADIQIGNVSVAEGAKVAPTISFNGVKLTTKDYTVTSSTGNLKFTAADLNPTITVVGKGNFAGEIKNIPVMVKTKAAIANTAIKVTMGKDISRTYDGKAQTLTVSTGSSSGELTVTAADGTVLTEGSDFVVSYGANVNAGTVKVTISGSGAYTGSVTKTFKILPDKNISTVTAKLADSAAKVMYDKNGAKPSIVVTADRNGNTIQLNEGVDYKITYANNKKVGNAATYTVAFLGNYQGRTQIKGSFEIVKADFGSAKVQAADMIYSKAGKYQSVPFVSIGGVQLAKTDYTVTYWYNGVDITGQKLTLRDDETSRVITVKVTGKGNYQADTAEGTYTIAKASTTAVPLAKAKIVAKGSMKAVPAQAYTGSAITPEIDVYVKNGKTWDKVDPSTYTVTYVNNVAKGKATILVSGDGIHTAGSKTATFRINTRSLKGFLFGKFCYLFSGGIPQFVQHFYINRINICKKQMNSFFME